MCSFHDLSNDVLLIIIDVMDPYDFESFAVICKRTYALSMPCRKTHTRLKGIYSVMTEDRYDSHQFVKLMRDICQNPFLALYIKTLSFGQFFPYNNANHTAAEDSEDNSVASSNPSMLWHRYPKIFSDYHSVIASWPQTSASGNGQFLALLLPFLSNLETLTLDKPDLYCCYYKPVMDIIKSKSIANPDTSPLRNLRSVFVFGGPHGTLLHFLPFMLLPSVRSFVRYRWDGVLSDEEVAEAQRMASSSFVERVLLYFPVAQLETLVHFLELFGHLKNLTLSGNISFTDRRAGTKDDGNSNPGGPNRESCADVFMRQLGKLCGATLSSLSLHISFSDSSKIKSFHEFKALSSLLVDVAIIFIPEKSSVPIMEPLIGTVSNGEPMPASFEVAVGPRLSALLSPSVTQFAFKTCSGWPNQLDDMFLDLYDDIPQLPCLQSIMVFAPEMAHASELIVRAVARIKVKLTWIPLESNLVDE